MTQRVKRAERRRRQAERGERPRRVYKCDRISFAIDDGTAKQWFEGGSLSFGGLRFEAEADETSPAYAMRVQAIHEDAREPEPVAAAEPRTEFSFECAIAPSAALGEFIDTITGVPPERRKN